VRLQGRNRAHKISVKAAPHSICSCDGDLETCTSWRTRLRLGGGDLPGPLAVLPASLRPSFGNSLVLGTLVGLGLNVLFRIGLRRTVSMTVAPGAIDPAALEKFLDLHGAAWGARSDVIVRAKFNLVQSIETLVSSGVATGCSLSKPRSTSSTSNYRCRTKC